MKIKIICAMGSNAVIGNKNELPWKGMKEYKFDMDHFKETTTGNIVVMGYQTYCSLGKKGLKDRINIVISRNHSHEIDLSKDSNIDYVFETYDELIQFIYHHKDLDLFRDKDMYIIGGSKLYYTFLEKDNVDELILTIFNKDFEGDRYFPIEVLLNKYTFKEEIIGNYPNGRIVKYTRDRSIENLYDTSNSNVQLTEVSRQNGESGILETAAESRNKVD